VPLPLLACRIRERQTPDMSAGDFALGPWQRSWSDEAYAEAIEACDGRSRAATSTR
jgi:hypothetical protein